MNELLGVYENLKVQTQAIFEMTVEIQALKMALNTNQSFAELYELTVEQVRSELSPVHDERMQAIDDLIQRIRQQSSQGDA